MTEGQARRLKALAAEEEVSMAELIRRSIDSYLKRRQSTSAEALKERALSVIGKYSSGLSDVSTRHDDYLAEAYGDFGE